MQRAHSITAVRSRESTPGSATVTTKQGKNYSIKIINHAIKKKKPRSPPKKQWSQEVLEEHYRSSSRASESS